jgi:BirA family biotin operon repressor/biotin-[acetyl-CoA-carboxylase] ligase
MNLDSLILHSLRESQAGISGAELAARVGVTRAAVWARIEELRRAGFDIAATPHSGYRLVSEPDVLLGDDLQSRLGPGWLIGREVRVFNETTSTNDIIEKLARDGVKEGMVVFAESQTRGRGRLGRRWVSPARRGLWFSVLLRPVLRPQAVTQITVMAATAIVRAIRGVTGLQPEIKWPNDVQIRGRKLAGILTEMSGEQDRVGHVVLGVGLDANQVAAEFPSELRNVATSLRIELGRPVERPSLAIALLRELDHDYRRVREGRFGQVADEWEAGCSTIGQDVTILMGARRLRGRAEALDDDGALLLRTEHGHLERVTGGDVTVEKGAKG